MFSQTLRTVLGDWTADTAGLGYEGGALVFGAMLALLALAYYRTKVSRTLLFWLAFILIRPLGDVLGDLLDKPLAAGGLDLSRYSASRLGPGRRKRRLGPAGWVRIVAAPDSVRLVLRNGLENAIKYGRAGGEVTLRIDADAQYATIQVIDDGPGIPAADRERVLEPFRRRAQASGQGSGLGLSIALAAAIRQGGTLELADRDSGAGLIFRYRQHRVR